MRFWFTASQCASSPSPSEDTMPMPVIQTSFAGEGWGSVMRQRLHGETDLVGHRIHVHAKRGIGEGGKSERNLGAALQFLADASFGLGDRKAGAFVFERRLDRQQLARADKAAHLG